MVLKGDGRTGPDRDLRTAVSVIGTASAEMDLRFVVTMVAWAVVSLAGVLWVIRPPGATSVTSANEQTIYLLEPFLTGAGALAIIGIRRFGSVDANGVSIADRLAYWSAVIVIGAVIWYGPVHRSGPGFAVALVTGTAAVIL